MSRPGEHAARASRPGLLAALMAAVRPEFRGDVLGFPASDPVFGGPACKVAGCQRPARNRGLCWGHHGRWYDQGRPELEEFAATTSPRWRLQERSSCCRADGCRYAAHGRQLCKRHLYAWRRAGQPDLDTWRPAAVAPPAAPQPCRVSWCGLWAKPRGLFCARHDQHWRKAGRPDPAEYADGLAADRAQRHEQIDVSTLGPQLKLEIQYALQCRRDDGTAQVFPPVASQLARLLAATTVTSLLDRPESTWAREFPAGRPRSLLLYAWRCVDDLAAGSGWETEYGRDAWRLRKLGFGGNAVLRFDPIPQPWLRELGKRWVRWRLSTGQTVGTARAGLRILTRFAVFLAAHRPAIGGLADVDRPVLERYLADLHAEWGGRCSHHAHIEQLNLFLRAIRQHRWDPSLPTTAVFYPEDGPQRGQMLPRALAEHVMTQVEDPANLDRWDNPAYRLITVILMRCGLRVSDATKLAFDCLACDADGAPYLRYYNHKMRREALVPIDAELHDQIRGQQQRLASGRPASPPVLFPRPLMNVDGTKPLPSGTYRCAMHQWLQQCDIRDDHGRPVHLTPHQWRHSLGTRLINRDIPQEVVRRILDHDSHAMTSHYARLSDTTIRRHWEQARKVNAAGHAVTLDPDGPLAEAAWAKQRIGRATQALPNGYCSLPLVKTCPHANACLTCPMFVTTAEFLPRHRDQYRQTLQIITAAEARGHTRQAEMNRQIAANLGKIITSLEADDPGRPEAAADAP
ncbi:MAG: tyrosine-type recombinase/integrase [Streptosporangiaceae bacterium]